MKQSSKIYRNIKGVRFEQLTSNPELFKDLKKECKSKGKKFRIVNGEFLTEVHNGCG